MKILTFFPVFRIPCQNFTYSGGERQFIEICKVWSALGNDIHVVTTNYGQKLMHVFSYDTSTYLYEPVSFRQLGISDFVDVPRMLEKMPEQRFDFIYAPGETFMCVIASGLARRDLKVPVVASFNLLGSYETQAIRHFLHDIKGSVQSRDRGLFLRALPRGLLVAFKGYVRNLFSRNFDLIFSVGSEVKRLLVEMEVNPARIFVTGIGVDLSRIQGVGDVENFYDACFMGQIIPRKGVADLVESWRLVIEEKPNARLIILGRGPRHYEAVIWDLVRKYGLEDNVSMPGFVSEDEKYRVLKGSSVFVFPSYLEASPLVIYEAMACGLPVVAYDLPFYGDWYGDVICSVSTGDVEGLSHEIIRLLGDEDLRISLGREGRIVAEQYSWENVAKYQMGIIKQRLMLHGVPKE